MRIALITGSRADRGALEMVGAALDEHDRYMIDVSTAPAVCRHHQADLAAGALCRAADTTVVRDYDIAIVHGDRFEILGAVIGFNILGVPVAHLGGGDLTEGSQDDCFRHAITKLSHLHFATCVESADRIIQMGEEPGRVHVTGDPGIDRVMSTLLLGRDETFAAVGLKSFDRALLVSLHPNTLANQQIELAALSDALKSLVGDTYFAPAMVLPVDEHLAQQRFGQKKSVGLVFIGPNADAGNDLIRKQWNSIVAEMPQQAVYHENMTGQVYLSLMYWCDAMVGNSSAGFYEAPCFGTPVVNIGDRQLGRPRHERIIECVPSPSSITRCINFALTTYARSVGSHPYPVKNPYGDGHAAERIAKIIGEVKDPKALLRKRFQTCRGMKACPLDGVTS